MPEKTRTLLIFILIIAFLLSGCDKTVETSSQTFTWKIQITRAEVKQVLKTTEIVTLYNGEKKEVGHENSPATGNVYLILNLGITKTNTNTSSFEWKDVSVVDAKGSSYPRLENDSFIVQHNYDPRMTGLAIRFGENKGWICFEVPQAVADGKLVLVHTTSEGQQKIEIKK